MPYITEEERVAYKQPLEGLVKALNDSGNQPGHLNYLITTLIDRYVFDKGVSYATIAEAISQATEAAAEYRRIVLVPYEDFKRVENGEVAIVPLTQDIPVHVI